MAANPNNNNNNGWNWRAILAASGVAVAATAVGVLAYKAYNKERPVAPKALHLHVSDEDSTDEEYTGIHPEAAKTISRLKISSTPADLVNLDTLLNDVYRRYVALKDDDFDLYYRVYCGVFNTLQEHMKKADAYYAQYSSSKNFAGSHFDGLRIGRPDEFDVDIVIRMPVSFAEYENVDTDMVLRPSGAGHVRIQGGRQFLNLPNRDNWQVNKKAYAWADSEGYLLRTKFRDWFRGVVARALNQLPTDISRKVMKVDGVEYVITTKDSGPAYTLIVANVDRDFRLDVDLVPALKFPETRWPPNSDYREIPPGCNVGDWIVVPKPERYLSGVEEARSWRVALHAQEKGIFYDLQHLRQIIRLIKKLRDSLGLKEIASYYIKTIFLWEVTNRDDPAFWKKADSVIFKVMVRRVYEAVCDRRIPYFWNERNNLIGHVHAQTLRSYELKLKKLVDLLDAREVSLMGVAELLLTADEFYSYKMTRQCHI